MRVTAISHMKYAGLAGGSMDMPRTVNIGCQDFETIRREGYFYVDKTLFIKEWWERADVVTLISRPRRFGKTLAMSMLEKFFPQNMWTGEVCLKDWLSGRKKSFAACRERIR